MLLLKDIDNLFMAGRCISVTHEALGTVRVMKTCGMMGEVVGKAASLCRQYECSPREVYQRYLSDLVDDAAIARQSNARIDRWADDHAGSRLADREDRMVPRPAVRWHHLAASSLMKPMRNLQATGPGATG
jgi:hypothetical protein